MKKLLLGLILAVAGGAASPAGELGSPAAPLKISEWVKGAAVDLAAVKGKQVVVVEFWATWCPPCRTSIPHLTEMQKQFKDVIFIGVTDEKADVVKKFVTKMGDKMDYVVAIDDDRQTSKGYMGEFDINGIPHAFIVDKESRVIWHGHPMAGLDKALEQITTGKFDLEQEKAKARQAAAAEEKEMAAQKKLRKLANLIVAGKDDAETKQLEAELVALDKESEHGLLGGSHFEPADFRTRVGFSSKIQKYQQAVQDSAPPETLAQLEKELAAGAPKDFDLKEFKEQAATQAEMQKASGVLEAYFEAAGENGDAAKATELANKVEALQLKNSRVLNQIAWTILTEDTVKHRDFKLASALAARAVSLSEGKDASIIDTYARALYDSGKVKEAIEQQKKALAAATDDEIKKEMADTLKKYQEKSAVLPGT